MDEKLIDLLLSTNQSDVEMAFLQLSKGDARILLFKGCMNIKRYRNEMSFKDKKLVNSHFILNAHIISIEETNYKSLGYSFTINSQYCKISYGGIDKMSKKSYLALLIDDILNNFY
jgi:hypothetical protein